MGLAFKPNIDDIRESPAKYIAQKVMQDSDDEIYYIVEPNIAEHNIFKITNYKEAAANADIIVFLAAHTEFKNLEIAKDKMILNFCGVNKQIFLQKQKPNQVGNTNKIQMHQ